MNRNIKTCLAFIIFISVLQPIASQEKTKQINPRGISLAYWGPVFGYWSPENEALGVKAGYSHNFQDTEKYSIIGEISLVLMENQNRYFSSGILLSSTLQRCYSTGFYFEHSFHLGYKGSQYYFDLYKTNSKGEIVNLNNRWNNSMILGYSIGGGYNFSHYTPLNIKLYCRPTIYYQIPNNDNIMLLNNYSFDMGIVYSPDFINQ